MPLWQDQDSKAPTPSLAFSCLCFPKDVSTPSLRMTLPMLSPPVGLYGDRSSLGAQAFTWEHACLHL